MAKVTFKAKTDTKEPAAKAPEVSEPKHEVSSVTKAKCLFCENKLVPSYTDSQALKKYLSDRARIVNKQRSKLCSKHHRKVTREIKRARFLALLPFVASV